MPHVENDPSRRHDRRWETPDPEADKEPADRAKKVTLPDVLGKPYAYSRGSLLIDGERQKRHSKL